MQEREAAKSCRRLGFVCCVRSLQGPLKRAQLFEEWLACDGKWHASSFIQRLQHRKEFSKHGCYRWMTRSILVEKYGTEELADEVIENKLQDAETRKSQVKAHPDFPKNEKMTLYLCWDNESETTKDRTIMDTTHTARDESPAKRRRSRSTSSERILFFSSCVFPSLRRRALLRKHRKKGSLRRERRRERMEAKRSSVGERRQRVAEIRRKKLRSRKKSD